MEKNVVSDKKRRSLFRLGLSALAAGALLKLVGSDEAVVRRVYGQLENLIGAVPNAPVLFAANTSTTGDAQGIQGLTQSPTGRGLVGFHQPTSGVGIGLDGVSNSPDGKGLRGANTAVTGDAIGVEASTNSPTGAIILGRGVGGVEKFRVVADGGIRVASGGAFQSGDIHVGTVTNAAFAGNSSLYVANDVGDANNSFRIDGASDALYLVADSGPGSTAGTSVIFRTAPAAGGELDRVKIDSAGNVAIGTANPQALLHVAGVAPNIIMGDSGNSITPGVKGATIGGGGGVFSPGNVNQVTGASAHGSTVSGGVSNVASSFLSTVGGGGGGPGFAGSGNLASGQVSTVAGGGSNTASGLFSTVGGGGAHSTRTGGTGNTASGQVSTVAGGSSNTASGDFSTVGGGGAQPPRTSGVGNTASGYGSTVPGGSSNLAAGFFSFAAGQRAKALHDGAFVWADSTNADFNSSATNQFNVRASGGLRIFSNAALTAGVTLAAGGNAWAGVCDRNLKENLAAVDGGSILERLSRIPITEWNLKSQNPSIRHMGPMAQDFYAAFHVGEDDRHITTTDADGVAFAAIQALYRLVRDENKQLRERLEALEQGIKPIPTGTMS